MFKDNLFQMRKLRHMTQEELAERLFVSRELVSKWELGQRKPDIRTLRIMYLHTFWVTEIPSALTAAMTENLPEAPDVRFWLYCREAAWATRQSL